MKIQIRYFSNRNSNFFENKISFLKSPTTFYFPETLKFTRERPFHSDSHNNWVGCVPPKTSPTDHKTLSSFSGNGKSKPHLVFKEIKTRMVFAEKISFPFPLSDVTIQYLFKPWCIFYCGTQFHQIKLISSQICESLNFIL